MKEILIMMLPLLGSLIALVILVDLYLLIRKYLKLKIQKLEKER